MGAMRSSSSVRTARTLPLMDLQMPEMNGVDAIIAIRNEFPEAPGRQSDREKVVAPHHGRFGKSVREWARSGRSHL